ncbi:DUF4173 domain-containing protein [Actinoplanes sp. NPDC051851]|uniref:DUF4153 domain-containing protein n=1 Tax=Actinoplanes sp. NPDC051851 TaxID=3154753 RepID=UPI00342DA6C3
MQGPPPPLTVLGHSWPGPGRPAPTAALVAIPAAAVVAALGLPLDRAGLGWLVTALAATIALIVAAAGRKRSAVPPLVPPPAARAHRDRFFWSTATVALLAVGTFRSAEWLFALCVLTATLTGVLAIGPGRSLRAAAATYLLAPFATLRALPWLTRGLNRVRESRRGGTPVRVIATAAVSVALLIVFGLLFASADAAFAQLFTGLLPDLRPDVVVRWVFVAGVTTALLGGAAFLRAAPPELSSLDETRGRPVRRLEWAVPLGLLVLLFTVFVGVQLTVLFGGEQHVLKTAGLTYAEYARGGFWQLCFVTGLVLVVLAGAARWAPRESAGDRRALRLILGALTVLTLVVVASAMQRMSVYTQTYGLTRMRLLVALCEGWFGLVLLLVLGAGLRIRAPWLPRVAIAAGVLALLGLAGANPDAMIARDQVSRPADRLDLGYLSTLSPDAAPEIATIADPADRACVLTAIGQAMEADDWRGWNLGRRTAREVIAEHAKISSGQCDDRY